MRFVTFCCVALFSLTFLTSPTQAQTAPLPSADHHTREATASLLAPNSDTAWRVVMPEMASLEKKAAAPALLALKPDPLSAAALAQGQSHTRVVFEASIGGFRPGGQLRDTELIRATVGGGFLVGVRPFNTPRIQLDAGIDLLFEGIGSPRREEVLPGEFRDIDDVEVFLNFGPRVYLTPRDSALKFSVGGGAAYAAYVELIPSDTDNDDDDFNNPPGFTCLTCEKRSGWGFYGMAQLRYQIKPMFGVGVTAKYYRVTTEGGVFTNNLPRRTTDDWLGVMLTFSFR
ncbi:MAG: hypothetical protein HOP19_16480 [Acidobacteria bacterium]|nr:hypothetical protein [Acidobacteriota bacterium]